MDKLITNLSKLLTKGDLLTGDSVSGRSAGWGKQQGIDAKAILRPATTKEVSAILAYCHHIGQTVVPHGGLTGVVGGTQTNRNDIVLSLEKMNQIEEIDTIAQTATVQAGVILQDLQENVEDLGLIFPLDLGARGSCMIGGNLATNAGGLRVIRYGTTRDLVLGLEVVLADGTILSSLNKLVKNNTGYELRHLFIGSEGTLGIITRAVLRLTEAPSSRYTALLALESFENVFSLLNYLRNTLNDSLSAFEVMWGNFYRLLTTRPALNKPPISQQYPFYVVIEALGTKHTLDDSRFSELLEHTITEGWVSDGTIATSQKERDLIWATREDVEQVYQFAPVFHFDVSLSIPEMKAYIEQVENALQSNWQDPRLFVYGHLGDGNLHLNVAVGKDNPETRKQVEAIIYQPLRLYGGSVSAEHGIGLDKKAYLSLSRSETEINMMRKIKNTLDPKGILNPGKIFDM